MNPVSAKIGPELNQKVVKKGDAPKMAQSQGLGSNLLSLAHSNESLAEGKAETGNWVALGCSGLLQAAMGCLRLPCATLRFSGLL